MIRVLGGATSGLGMLSYSNTVVSRLDVSGDAYWTRERSSFGGRLPSTSLNIDRQRMRQNLSRYAIRVELSFTYKAL